MKVILLFVVVAFAAATPIKKQWTTFKRQHGKSYHSIEEEQLRMAIFAKKQKMIEEHNAKYKAGLATYYMQMNHFGDMLPEEVTQLGFNSTGDIRNVPSFTFLPPANVEIPESIDWRQLGAVTPVKDQSACGSCWAFSSTGALEGQLFRKTGQLVSLSEQQLLDCSKNYLRYRNNGCHGGAMRTSFWYLEKIEGLENEDSYPYEGKDGRCRYDPNKVVPGTKVKDFTCTTTGDDDALKAAVATVGPISVGVSNIDEHFMSYKGGIFDCETRKTGSVHSILVVGYGSDEGNDYWLIKNSWSPGWGEKGYMRLTRSKKNACGISADPCYPTLL